jgi:RNA polymerase sigma-70 factor (ECF subfamily)
MISIALTGSSVKWNSSSAVPIGSMTDSEDLSFDDMLNTITSDPIMSYEELEKNETALNVGQIIASMPDNLREILLLSYFQRFSYKQMAEILSIPIGTVKSRLHTAVGRFAKDWKESVRNKEVK